MVYRFSDTLADIGFYLFRGFSTRSVRNVGFALGEKSDWSRRLKKLFAIVAEFFSRLC